MWELDHKEGWMSKNWCFWTVVLEKSLEVPWTARRSNQSILKEIHPQYSLEELMLKLQNFGHLMESANSLGNPWCWERLKAGGEEDNRGWDGWMASSTQETWIWASPRRWRRTGKPGVLQSMAFQRVGHNKRLNNSCYVRLVMMVLDHLQVTEDRDHQNAAINMVHVHAVVNFFHLVVVLAAEKLRKYAQLLLSRHFKERS